MSTILKFPDSIYLIIGFLVPGLIIIFVRSKFVTGRQPLGSAIILSCLTVTVIYYALVFPVFVLVLEIQESGYQKILAWYGLVIVGPGIVGFVLGIVAQNDSLRSFLRLLGLNLVHTIPTAWDGKFANMNELWVLVTLKNDTRFAGFCSHKSIISSDPAERDIYIQWIYDVGEDGKWKSRGENGVLIAAGEIQSIEFWPHCAEETTHEQE